MSHPPVSIVIPTRNGMETLPALFEALGRQRIDAPVEIVAVDSASTDGTAAFLRARADLVVEIPAAEFDHGLTRNLGVERSGGDFVVLMVQDALPASDGWLAALTAPLFSDAAVAGAFARQQPRPGASAITRYYAERAVAAGREARVVALARDELRALHPLERLHRCTFDNVCSCVRRSVWEAHPFKPTPIAEDLEWALEVLLAGHRLAYAPDAVVTHSHDRSARYEFARTYVLHRRLHELLGVRTIPTMPSLGRAILGSMRLHWACERAPANTAGTASSLLRALALALAWPLGQYLGALSAVRGWKTDRWGVV